MDIAMYVFSFNRGGFLQNCLDSISECVVDLPVIIIDDQSYDIKTLDILESYRKKIRVVSMGQRDLNEEKTGGLYGNMSYAMHDAREKSYDFVVFIQDDMQMVRKLLDRDIDYIKNYFNSNKLSIQLSTNFIRKLSEPEFLIKYSLDESGSAYLRHGNYERGKSSFSATGVFSVERFFSLFGSFEASEVLNSHKAREAGLVCGRAVYPFMNWLPYPISFRGKKRSFYHKALELLGGSGFYPISIMSEAEVDLFMRRDANILPIMESYLKSPGAPRRDIWSTGGGEYNLLARDGMGASIFKALRAAKQRVGSRPPL